jgi:hypothetical protein
MASVFKIVFLNPPARHTYMNDVHTVNDFFIGYLTHLYLTYVQCSGLYSANSQLRTSELSKELGSRTKANQTTIHGHLFFYRSHSADAFLV